MNTHDSRAMPSDCNDESKNTPGRTNTKSFFTIFHQLSKCSVMPWKTLWTHLAVDSMPMRGISQNNPVRTRLSACKMVKLCYDRRDVVRPSRKPLVNHFDALFAMLSRAAFLLHVSLSVSKFKHGFLNEPQMELLPAVGQEPKARKSRFSIPHVSVPMAKKGITHARSNKTTRGPPAAPNRIPSILWKNMLHATSRNTMPKTV